MTHLREATLDDLDAICVLGEAVNALHHQDSPRVFAAPGDPKKHEAHWRNSLGRNDSTTFVAVSENNVVGFITVSLATDSHSLLMPVCFGRIGTVGVAQHLQGQGIGAKLMQHAQSWAQSKGGTEMRLTVGAFNEDAIRLYQTLGYQTRALQLAKEIL
jgi:ribosomal protein S18 acetylase RimI-like enzyme